MMSFFALIIVYFEKYNAKSGIGSLIATMLPYSVSFFIVWTLLIIGWILLGLQLGPEAGLYYVK
jgi:aminobenzoyl-glutamate transport protein